MSLDGMEINCHQCLITAACALISFVASFGMMASLFYFGKWKTISGRLLICLAVSDVLQAIANMLSVTYIAKDAPKRSPTCIAQGWLQSIADMSGILSAAFIALYLVVAIRQVNKQQKVFERIAISIILVFPTLLSTTGWIVSGAELNRYWGPAGGWCWISDKFTYSRWVFMYIWVLLIFILLFVTYGIVILRLWRSHKMVHQINRHANKKRKRSMQKMFAYPIIFFVVYFPIALDRIFHATLSDVPKGFIWFTSGIYCLNGFFNAVAYGAIRYRMFKPKESEQEKQMTNRRLLAESDSFR